MLSIRTFSRIVPRSLSRISNPSQIAPKQVLQQSIWKNIRVPAATFSTSLSRDSKDNNGDNELIRKFESELEVEKSLQSDIVQPTTIKDFMENSPFRVIDEPGKEEVVLTRTYGKEKLLNILALVFKLLNYPNRIQLSFSISDLSMDPEEFSGRGFDDENENENSMNGEDENEQNNGERASDEEDSIPVPVHVVIEKPKMGALVLDLVIRDGTITVETCFYYANSEHAYAKTPDKFHERQTLYAGPSFASLDEGLQQLLERYIDERDINTTLALFVQEYMEMKEQKEYMRWLTSVKEFIKA
ncbi:Mitochondrial acidic protein mam33 [Golovinomyces cichoracearum]|uniref:Mitochondrial acidic protein mam33 n=1 Tax=Golovinomyces cichoracearum TaxID=62708 RepID=A0A420JAH1_9PEZI|nr:Mitochondrial acidic protein mam33 [Golovinomyces cichoracearum]